MRVQEVPERDLVARLLLGTGGWSSLMTELRHALSVRRKSFGVGVASGMSTSAVIILASAAGRMANSRNFIAVMNG